MSNLLLNSRGSLKIGTPATARVARRPPQPQPSVTCTHLSGRLSDVTVGASSCQPTLDWHDALARPRTR